MSPYRDAPKAKPFEVFTRAEKRWILWIAIAYGVVFAVCWRTGCMVFDL